MVVVSARIQQIQQIQHRILQRCQVAHINIIHQAINRINRQTIVAQWNHQSIMVDQQHVRQI